MDIQSNPKAREFLGSVRALWNGDEKALTACEEVLKAMPGDDFDPEQVFNKALRVAYSSEAVVGLTPIRESPDLEAASDG